MKQALLILALASCFFTASADGATITWASGTSGNWSSPTNWSPNQVPGSSDTAVITASGNYTVNVDTTVTVSGLVLGSSDATAQTVALNGQSMAITQSTTVNTNGVINMSSGALTFDYNGGSIINGTLTCSGGTLSGMITIASNAVVNLANTLAGTQTVDFAALTLTNYGTMVWSNLDIQCPSSTEIYNYNLLNIQSDNTFTGNSGAALNNYGTIRKNVGTYAPPNYITRFNTMTLNNSNTVDVEMGAILFSGGIGGGWFNTATNAGLALGNFTLTGDTTFSGPGAVQGTLYGQNGIVHGSMAFDYGSFSGTLTVATDGVVNLVGIDGETTPIALNGLTLTNYGTVISSNLNIDCQSTAVINYGMFNMDGVNGETTHNSLNYVTLTSYGTIIWSNVDLDCTSAQIYNYGLWDAKSDNTFYGNSGGGSSTSTFNNYGIVRKDGGTIFTIFDGATTFNNSGTVDVETAQCEIETGSGGGLFNTATNAVLWLGQANDFGLSGDVTFTGPGLVGGNLYGFNASGVIHGSLNFFDGWLGGYLTVARNGVANLVGQAGQIVPIDLNYLTLTNCGTIIWSNVDLACSSAQVYNYGLWDAQSDNTFHGGSSGVSMSTFNNYGTVRKDGGTMLTIFDGATTFNNSGTVDVQTAQLAIEMGSGGGLFNTASDAVLWLGQANDFGLSGDVTFTGPGFVGGNLYGFNTSGVIHGSLNFFDGWLGGYLTVASNAVANLVGYAGQPVPVDLNYLTLTNCGTVIWNNVNLACSSAQIYNYGLWDAQSDNTFSGGGNGVSMSTFNNYGAVRKDGGTMLTIFDGATTFNNSGTVDVQTAQLAIETGSGGGLFNTASNAVLWLGQANDFGLSGNVTFTGPGFVGGNLYGFNTSGVIHGSLNFFDGWLGGYLTVASNAVANLIGYAGQSVPVDLNYLTLTNCGTVTWNNVNLACSSAQIYNYGLWDAQSDNTFSGGGNGVSTSTFNNYGTVRKDGGTVFTIFDGATTFNNSGTVDVQTAQLAIETGSGGGLFNTASNAVLWLGQANDFGLSGDVTFTGPGMIEGNLYGYNTAGVIHGSLNFSDGSLGGYLTVASNAVANLIGTGIEPSPLDLNFLTLTNCGTVDWNDTDLECSSAQIYNYGLWDAQSDNTFSGGGNGVSTSTFNNYGTVRKDGSSGITTFDNATTFNNPGKTDVQMGQVALDGGCSLTNGTLNFGISGPAQFGTIDFANYVQLAGRLSVNFTNHYTPALSNSFPVVAYNSETGTFAKVCLPALSSGLFWQTNYTSTDFTLSVVAAAPLQLSAGLSTSGDSMSLSWYGLLGQTYQVQCATNLAPANWVNLGGPIIGTNGPIAVLDSIITSPQKYYRIQSQ